MHIKIRILISYLIMAILLTSCNNNKKSISPTNDKSLSIKVQLPSSGEAIKHIQTHVARTNQTVMVPTSYVESVQRKKRCDQYDWDLGRCSGADSGSKYGYKMVTEKVKKCCRSEPKLVSKVTGQKWLATYLAPKDEWSVTLEYKDDSKTEQKVSWSISAGPSNGLQVEFGG